MGKTCNKCNKTFNICDCCIKCKKIYVECKCCTKCNKIYVECKCCTKCNKTQDKCTCLCYLCHKIYCICPIKLTTIPLRFELNDHFINKLDMASTMPEAHQKFIKYLADQKASGNCNYYPSNIQDKINAIIPPPLKPKDPFLLRIREALEKPEDHQEFINILYINSKNEVYPPYIWDEVKTLIPFANISLPKTSKVLVHNEGDLRKLKLTGIKVIPDIIKKLKDFQNNWNKIIKYVSYFKNTQKIVFTDFDNYTRSLYDNNNKIHGLYEPAFWSGLYNGPWGDKENWNSPGCIIAYTIKPRNRKGKTLVSPYFNTKQIGYVSKLAPNGDNSWLDRFLSARIYFWLAYNDLTIFIQKNNIILAEGHDIQPELLLKFTNVKCEFAALFALVFGTLPLYDPSIAGQTDGKWESVRGSFVFWTSTTEYEPLSDPDNLHKMLRGVKDKLIDIGKYLVQLPGSFVDFNSKIENTINVLRNKQLLSISQFIISDNELLCNKQKEESKSIVYEDHNKKQLIYKQQMLHIRLIDVLSDTFDDTSVDIALSIRILKIPFNLILTREEKKEILFILLLDLPPNAVISSLAYKGLNVVSNGPGLWLYDNFVSKKVRSFDSTVSASVSATIGNGPHTEDALREKYMLNLSYKDVLKKSFGDEDITKALENYGIKLPSQLTISLQQKEKKELILILLFNLPSEAVIDTFAYKGMKLVQKEQDRWQVLEI